MALCACVLMHEAVTPDRETEREKKMHFMHIYTGNVWDPAPGWGWEVAVLSHR